MSAQLIAAAGRWAAVKVGGEVLAGHRLGSSALRMWPLGPTFYFLHFLGRGPAWCGAAVPGTGRVTDCSSGNITSYHATAAGHREGIRQREAPHCSCGPVFPSPSFTPPRVQVQADDEVQSPVRSGAGETQIVRHWLGWAGLGWLAQLSAVSWPRGAASPASCQLCCAAPLRTAATADKASRNYGLCPLLASV